MENKFISSVERNKAASNLCKGLFPSWNKPPTQGELQRIITLSWGKELNNSEILAAGNWWLWIRDMFIENTITKEQKDILKQIAVTAAKGNTAINIISARSPELLHAQVAGQGNTSLPRSRKALMKINEVVSKSQEFIPTIPVIIFADLAIDNFQNISKACNVEEVIQENIERLKEIAKEIGLEKLQILRMSKLIVPQGELGSILTPDGQPLISINLNFTAERLITIAGKESVESHKKMFGWSEDESLAHTRNIGITMGLVGEAIKTMFRTGILIHNESFISRGALNNLFNDTKNPLPVISLRDLLETKRVKE